MMTWKAKRFWKAAQAVSVTDGWEVQLDGRPVKTPAKVALRLPTQALAEAIATEWDSQDGEIDPTKMPLTRMANSAIDKVMPQKAEVAGMLAAYGDSDLLCYRAEGPEALVARQAEAWDSLLAWAAAKFDAPLNTTAGILHSPQPKESLVRLASEVEALDVFTLAAFHDLVALTGSLVIAFAVLEGVETPEILWEKSRVDEVWQAELWGQDAEAMDAVSRKRADFLQAVIFVSLLKPILR